MKKEIGLAILAGGTFGLIIAFAIWKGNSLLKIKKEPESTPSSSIASSTPKEEELKIKIVEPNNLAVLTQTQIALSGITNPNAFIAISGESGDLITTASDSGNFNTNIELEGGANQIKLFTFTKDGSSATSNLLLVYSSQFTPKDSTEKPVCYIGTITDITNSTIQIKNEGGDVQQISATPDVTLVDTRNDNIKTLKLSEIAIGDYILALGYKNGNSILSSSRIIVTSPLTKTTRTAFFGNVTNAESGKITLKNPKSNESITVTPGDNLEIDGVLRFSQIKVGDNLITVGVLKNGNIDARTIKIVK